MCNDLAEAMKALEGKKMSGLQYDIRGGHSQGLSHPYHARHVKRRDNIRVDALYWTFCFG